MSVVNRVDNTQKRATTKQERGRKNLINYYRWSLHQTHTILLDSTQPVEEKKNSKESQLEQPKGRGGKNWSKTGSKRERRHDNNEQQQQKKENPSKKRWFFLRYFNCHQQSTDRRITITQEEVLGFFFGRAACREPEFVFAFEYSSSLTDFSFRESSESLDEVRGGHCIDD